MCNKYALFLFITVHKLPILEGNGTFHVTVGPDTSTSSPAEGITPLVPTYPLPPGGKICSIYFVNFPRLCADCSVHTDPVCLFVMAPCFLGCLDECWSPLGVQFLPATSFTASSQQPGHPAAAARLHGWDPDRDLQVPFNMA